MTSTTSSSGVWAFTPSSSAVGVLEKCIIDCVRVETDVSQAQRGHNIGSLSICDAAAHVLSFSSLHSHLSSNCHAAVSLFIQPAFPIASSFNTLCVCTCVVAIQHPALGGRSACSGRCPRPLARPELLSGLIAQFLSCHIMHRVMLVHLCALLAPVPRRSSAERRYEKRGRSAPCAGCLRPRCCPYRRCAWPAD